MPCDLCQEASACTNNSHGNDHEFLYGWMWKPRNVFYGLLTVGLMVKVHQICHALNRMTVLCEPGSKDHISVSYTHLEAAGYRYDYRESKPGHIVLAPDGTHEIAGYLQFESWEDIKDWLEDTIAEGTDISERVDRALYPFKFDYTLEEEMFRGNGDRYAIYHVDEGTPGKQHLFMNMTMVKEDGITIDADNYKCVYSGRLHENEKLDDLYAMFNDNPPADYKAHSMSVSDVIITNRGGDMQAYYVDRFGFAELPDFAAQREKILDIVPEIENVDYENDLDVYKRQPLW